MSRNLCLAIAAYPFERSPEDNAWHSEPETFQTAAFPTPLAWTPGAERTHGVSSPNRAGSTRPHDLAGPASGPTEAHRTSSHQKQERVVVAGLLHPTVGRKNATRRGGFEVRSEE